MANNPNHTDNLKPFSKGHDDRRNLEGRPEGVKNRSTIIKKWLDVNTKVKNPETGKEEAATVEDKVWLAALNKAIKTGDINVVREIMDSAYGKAQQSVTVGGDSDNPLIHKIIIEDVDGTEI